MATATTTKVTPLIDTLRKLKVDNVESIKGKISFPEDTDTKAQKALEKIKEKYQHKLYTLAGAEIFRLTDEGKLAVIFECGCGTLSLCRTSDLWQRTKCSSCVTEARKSKRAKKVKKDKPQQESKPIPTMEELMSCTKRELQETANALKCDFEPKTTKSVLSEMIIEAIKNS